MSWYVATPSERMNKPHRMSNLVLVCRFLNMARLEGLLGPTRAEVAGGPPSPSHAATDRSPHTLAVPGCSVFARMPCALMPAFRPGGLSAPLHPTLCSSAEILPKAVCLPAAPVETLEIVARTAPPRFILASGRPRRS